MASSLQGLIVQPRSPVDRKTAKTDNIKYEEHDDGFLYKMLDEKDWKKYRILSEEEEFEEMSKSREIKESMYTLTGKFKDGKYVNNDKAKSGLKFVPPMFGTTSRNAKAAKKAWESDMAAGLDAGSGSVSLKTKGAKFQNTILELAKNSQANAEQKEESDDEEEFRYRKHHPTQSEFDNATNPQSPLFDVVNTMKNKYEQNLYVVEKLYNEKQSMEKYIEQLERDLRDSITDPRRFRESYQRPGQDFSDYPEPRLDYTRGPQGTTEDEEEVRAFRRHMRETYGSEQPPYSEYDHRPQYSARSDYSDQHHLQHSAYEPPFRGEESKHSYQEDRRRHSTAGHRFTADDLAASTDRRTSAASIRGPTASNSNNGGRTQVRSHSAPRGGRDPVRYSAAMMSSMDAEFHLDRSDPCSVRSSSAMRRSTGGLSTQLQADADRYVQKRRMLEEKERLQQLEEKKRLQEQKERLLKASKSGRQFTEMFERQQQAEENSKARQEMQRAKEREEKQRQYEEKQKQAAQKQRLLDEAIKNAPSWSQIQTLEEEKRRERVERRKQELSMLMGSAAQSNLMSTTPRRDTAAAAPTQTFTYRAKDPAEVARALAEQKKARDQQLDEQRRKQKEKQIALEEAAEAAKNKTTLELRKEIYDEKYRKRQEAKAEKELEMKRAKEAAERRKHRQIMNMHVPIGKNTKSMELKAEKIKMDLERQKAEDRKHALLLKKKALSEKETAAVVRTLVKEREMERLGGHAGYSEINNTDAVIAAKAAAARREYKEQLRANQRKLEESLKSRPSLLERHDKKIVGKEAAKDANKKFKEIVASSGVAEKDDIYAKLGLDEDF